jgi:hypothetical protein
LAASPLMWERQAGLIQWKVGQRPSAEASPAVFVMTGLFIHPTA